jgi:uncharacterized phage protein (TIGR01671 family)
MNRVIKFRGKTFHDEWIYGVPVPSADRKMWALFNSFDDFLEPFDKVTVRPETIGQYTGLKDVDGKEIYEGDIVETFTLNLAYQQVGNYPPPNVEVEEWEILREVNEVDFREGSFCVGSWPIALDNYIEQGEDGDLSSDEQRFEELWESNAYDVQDKYPYLTWQHFIKQRVIGNIHDNPELLSETK